MKRGQQSIREILGSKKVEPKGARPGIFEDEIDGQSVASGMTVVNVDELRAEMKPFKELLEEYKEMKLRFSGMVALPPRPTEVKGGKPKGFQETLAYATVQGNYMKVWRKMKEIEEKNNATKVKLFAFLQAVADLSEGREDEAFDEVDVNEFYAHAGEEANSVIALWTLNAKAEKMTLEEYVNRYVKF